MYYYLVSLVAIYLFLSLMNVTSCGPEYEKLRKESKENDEWVNQYTKNNKSKFVSQEYRYYTLLVFVLIPFHTLTKDNRFYIVRLIGYFADIVYGGVGMIVWLIIYLTKNILDALFDVFFKLKDL